MNYPSVKGPGGDLNQDRVDPREIQRKDLRIWQGWAFQRSLKDGISKVRLSGVRGAVNW